MDMRKYTYKEKLAVLDRSGDDAIPTVWGSRYKTRQEVSDAIEEYLDEHAGWCGVREENFEIVKIIEN